MTNLIFVVASPTASSNAVYTTSLKDHIGPSIKQKLHTPLLDSAQLWTTPHCQPSVNKTFSVQLFAQKFTLEMKTGMSHCSFKYLAAFIKNPLCQGCQIGTPCARCITRKPRPLWLHKGKKGHDASPYIT